MTLNDLRVGVATAVFVLAVAPAGGQTIWRVDDSALLGGSGQGWSGAFRELQSALRVARPGDEIRVAGGVYRPDYDPAGGAHTGDRAASFALVDRVRIVGGYAGLSGPDPDFRDPLAHVTILSGDLAADDGPGFEGIEENSYHVVTMAAAGRSARLVGLTIAAGNADGEGHDAGGGLLCTAGTVVLDDCRIAGNFAAFKGGGLLVEPAGDVLMDGCVLAGNRAGDRGGAMFVTASSPYVKACTFEGNSAARYGGAGVLIEEANATFLECTFVANEAAELEATGGGALVVAASSPVLIDCVFQSNRSHLGRAGALYNRPHLDGTPGGSGTLVDGCTFHANFAHTGGAIYDEQSSPILSDCSFTANIATEGRGGGGVWDEGGSSLIVGCTFTDNAGFNGGGLYFGDHSTGLALHCLFQGNVSINDNGGALSIVESDVLITRCTFIDNTATGEGFVVGGGLSNYLSAPTVTDCLFAGNSAVFGGGGIYNENGGIGGPVIARCAFRDNQAPYGAGMYNFLSSPAITNCLFAGNTAAQWGGGLYNDFQSSPLIRHCTIVANTATLGGGMNNHSVSGSPTVSHSILWGNGPDQIADDPSTPTTVSYSDIEGGWTGQGAGNLDADPAFLDALGGDFRLRLASPCVDRGDRAFTPDPGETDLAGLPRVAPGGRGGQARVDIGAFELPGGAAPGVLVPLVKGDIRR